MATNRDIRNIYFWSPRWLTLWVTLLPVLQHRNIFLWSHISAPPIIKSVFVEADVCADAVAVYAPPRVHRGLLPEPLRANHGGEKRGFPTRQVARVILGCSPTIVDDSLEVSSLRCIPLWLIRVKRVVKTWQSSCTQL